MSQIPLTSVGSERLKLELKHLKSVRRPEIIEAIATARDHGDLKENAEYHAAREEQSFTEGRIAELESALSNAQIIDITRITQRDRVVFGCTVVQRNIAPDKGVGYKVVGDIEADIRENRIAISSPIARALIGKEEGEDVVVEAPGGNMEYAITAIRFE
jgi:transcription elongation factor GreA